MILPLLLIAAPVCGQARPSLEGPVPVSFFNGRFGAPRHACPRTEIAVGGVTNLAADVDNFYGNIRASGLLTWSFALADDLEAFVELEPIRYQTVISSLSADTLGFGHTSIGGTHLLYNGGVAISGSARVSLPTATNLYRDVYPLSADVSGLLSTWVHPDVEIHGVLGATSSFGVGRGVADPRVGVYLLGGTTWRPVDWFALVADADLLLFYHDDLRHLSLGGGPRFLLGRFGIDLFVEAPLVGAERTTIAGLLLLRYNFKE